MGRLARLLPVAVTLNGLATQITASWATSEGSVCRNEMLTCTCGCRRSAGASVTSASLKRKLARRPVQHDMQQWLKSNQVTHWRCWRSWRMACRTARSPTSCSSAWDDEDPDPQHLRQARRRRPPSGDCASQGTRAGYNGRGSASLAFLPWLWHWHPVVSGVPRGENRPDRRPT